jgi:hypothetical protein
MYNYKLQFNNGAKFTLTAINLDVVYNKVIPYINNNNLIECVIDCGNGKKRSVTKNGAYHHAYNGFQFNVVQK